MKLNIRECTWSGEDFEKTRALHELVMKPSLSSSIGWDTEAQRSRLLDKFKNKDGLYIVECDGDVVGTVKIYRKDSGVFYIEQLYIHPDYQHTRVVFMLIKKIREVSNGSVVQFYSMKSDHSIDYTKKKNCFITGETDTLLFFEYIV